MSETLNVENHYAMYVRRIEELEAQHDTDQMIIAALDAHVQLVRDHVAARARKLSADIPAAEDADKLPHNFREGVRTREMEMAQRACASEMETLSSVLHSMGWK